MIRRPSVLVTASQAPGHAMIEDRRHTPLGAEEERGLRLTLEGVQKVLGSPDGWAICIDGELSSHIGLGSGTAIRVAAVEALCRLGGHELSRERIQELSGRGGVSGIGIHGYFDGGFQFDVGVTPRDDTFRPSSSFVPSKIPTLLCRLSMPSWPISIVVPTAIRPVSRIVERRLFETTLPLSHDETLRTLETAVLAVSAAIAEQDFAGFATGLRRMQDSAWKRGEWSLHGPELRAIERDLYKLGASGVALSSMGPTLACVGPASFHERLARLGRKDLLVYVTRSDDHGRRIVD